MIHKLLYRIRVHQQFNTEVHTKNDDFIHSLQQIILQNLTKNDVLFLSKGKLMKRKFLYVYQELLGRIEEITNSHYFQIKKQAAYYESPDLCSGLSLPFRVTFV